MSTRRTIAVAPMAELRESITGRVTAPGDTDYEAARSVWNAIADKYPGVIVQCTSRADVREALRFARANDLVVAVRGGGHSVAGFSTCDGGVVIDLSGMRAVSVDPVGRVARVQGGALLEQLDRAAQQFGLACPVGVVGHTGVGGLTLGGGMGRLQRKLGYTIDNLISVELVTADGTIRRASAGEDPDLFWGIRGAGANFGVVTEFELRLHPVAAHLTRGAVVFPIQRAREAAALYRDIARTAPSEVHLALNFATAPTGRAAVGEPGGEATVAIGAVHFGDASAAERDLRRLRRELEPLADTFASSTYLEVQAMSDEEMAWGKRFYMKGAFIDDLTDAAVDRAAEHVSMAPGECSIGLWAQGGAIATRSEDEMAFTGRRAAFWIGAEAFWLERDRDHEFIEWGRAAMASLKPFTTAGHYVNDLVESGEDVVRSIYGDAKYDRLRALKRRLDPDNVFRLNQNIRP